MGNIFYFDNINAIGGVETFFYYLAKKYKDLDITIYYKTGNANQIKRLKKLVRVKKYTGEIIKCNKAFFNYALDIINNVEAKEYIQVIHADYKMQNIKPNLNSKITKYIGVSKEVCKSFTEITGKPCELCYNPVVIDDTTKVLKLISATRLTAEKGKERIKRLADILDKKGVKYMWIIFTNDTSRIANPNIIYAQPKLDITNYIKEADFLVQLSSSEAYCFSVVESLILDTPVIVTDLPVYNEIGVNDSNSIKLNLNFNDIDVDLLFKDYEFKYEPKEDNYINILDKTKSTYEEELKMQYKVEALDTYENYNVTDTQLGYVPKAGETFIVSKERLDVLLGENNDNRVYVKVLEEIKDEVTEEVVQAVANAIVEEAEEQNKTVETIVEEIVKESKPKNKPKTKKGGK